MTEFKTADDLHRCRRDTITLVKLILSEKSKDTMKIEVIKFLMENKGIYMNYITELEESNSCDTGNIANTIDVEIVNEYKEATKSPSENDKDFNSSVATDSSRSTESYVHSEHFKNMHQSIEKPNAESGQKFITTSHIQETPNSYMITKKNARKTTKKHKSKMQKTVDFDSRKNKTKPAKHKNKGKSFCLGTEQKLDVKKGKMNYEYEASNRTLETSSENNVHASEIINSLICARNRQEQNKALELIRSDSALRRTFIKRASTMRKVKIPIFKETYDKNDNYENKNSSENVKKKNTNGPHQERKEVNTFEVSKIHSPTKSFSLALPPDSPISNLNLLHVNSGFTTECSTLHEPIHSSLFSYDRCSESEHTSGTKSMTTQVSSDSNLNFHQNSISSATLQCQAEESYIYDFESFVDADQNMFSSNNLLSLENISHISMNTGDLLH